jgi:uncharacterized hydrophobic protein (TIGR00271 family)
MRELIEKLLHYFNLDMELEDNDTVHDEIAKGITFRGTNLWILVFAIVIASVGLNMNSTAVIIGAMLISPLMGPINGMGYSLATYNLKLFSISIKNFGFAVVTSLVTSTLYFAISPISTAHSELLARTSPTIYDVLIALFGGLAGIVATASRLKGNVIPGVAIATALMPPLCTAGYGLATAQFEFFFGAFYLFTINTVFIALASVAISQILKFPNRTLVNVADKQKVNRWTSLVIVVVFLPSVYFGYVLVQKERFIEEANRYVKSVGTFEGNFLLGNDIDAKEKTIKLVYGGTDLSDDQEERIKEKASSFKLQGVKIDVKNGLKLDLLSERNTELYSLKEDIINLKGIINRKEEVIDSLKANDALALNLLAEAQAFYPQIVACSYALTQRFFDSGTAEQYPILLFKVEKSNVNEKDYQRLQIWAQNRLNMPQVKLIIEND